jgi:hypothetical protein
MTTIIDSSCLRQLFCNELRHAAQSFGDKMAVEVNFLGSYQIGSDYDLPLRVSGLENRMGNTSTNRLLNDLYAVACLLRRRFANW